MPGNPRKEEVVIEIKDLCKKFGERTILKNVSFKVHRGETLVIMGTSGGGKSTLLWNLVRVHQPDSGKIFYNGQDVTQMNDQEFDSIRKRFGILFQAGALYNSMTVGENVALPLREHSNLSDDLIEIVVKMKLELVGLRDAENLMPHQISGGMKKRVGLARAIAMDPEILFYDEPSAGLDPVVTAAIDELINDLAHKLNVTSVVVTHDMTSAFRIADRMILLYRGEIAAEGSPDEIRKSTNPFVQQFINGSPDGPIPLRMSSKDYAEDLLEVRPRR